MLGPQELFVMLSIFFIQVGRIAVVAIIAYAIWHHLQKGSRKKEKDDDIRD